MENVLPNDEPLSGRAASLANLKPPYGSPDAPPRYTEIEDAPKPWSYRNSAKRMAAMKVPREDWHDDKKVFEGRTPTMAEYAAWEQAKKAATGDTQAFKVMTEQVDGKVAQVNINAQLAMIQGMTDAELFESTRALAAELGITIEGDFESIHHADGGDSRPQAEDGDAAVEVSDGQAAAAPGVSIPI